MSANLVSTGSGNGLAPNQPTRDSITLERGLSLAGRKPRISPECKNNKDYPSYNNNNIINGAKLKHKEEHGPKSIKPGEFHKECNYQV